MKNPLNICILLFIAFAMTGCDQTVKDFASGAIPAKNESPSTGFEAGASLKVSPAKLNLSHANGAIQGNVSLTNRTYQAGADMAVNLTINRTTRNQ